MKRNDCLFIDKHTQPHFLFKLTLTTLLLYIIHINKYMSSLQNLKGNQRHWSVYCGLCNWIMAILSREANTAHKIQQTIFYKLREFSTVVKLSIRVHQSVQFIQNNLYPKQSISKTKAFWQMKDLHFSLLFQWGLTLCPSQILCVWGVPQTVMSISLKTLCNLTFLCLTDLMFNETQIIACRHVQNTYANNYILYKILTANSLKSIPVWITLPYISFYHLQTFTQDSLLSTK